MTRQFRARRITQPVAVVRARRDRRDPLIDSRSFTCFRLVPDEDTLHAIELVQSSARMFVFTAM